MINIYICKKNMLLLRLSVYTFMSELFRFADYEIYQKKRNLMYEILNICILNNKGGISMSVVTAWVKNSTLKEKN